MGATEELRRLLDKRGIHWWAGADERKTLWESNGLTWEYFNDEGDDAWLGFLGACEQDITPEQAIAATLGWIDEPDTIRNELTDGGLIADVLAPVCVDEKERRAFERGRVHERFAQQIFKEATS